jgi:serine/threonine protein kinase
MTSPSREAIYQYEPLWGVWRIGQLVGSGSFGSIYRISREEMGHRYEAAVKIISIPNETQYNDIESSLGKDEEALAIYFEGVVRSLVSEIKILYSLSGNTNIINYQDHLVIRNQNRVGWDVLIRMEFINSLRTYQQDHEPTQTDVVRMGIDLCSALVLCSKKGIIHRDIKDENIFVNENGVYKLGDFGIARELSKSGRAASTRGTPLFMAPEVFRGDPYDATVDIYSLGIVMYKQLNHGRMPLLPPYPMAIRYQDTAEALDRRIAGEMLPAPDRIPRALSQIILKACSFQPGDRYQTALSMKIDLEQFLKGMEEAGLEADSQDSGNMTVGLPDLISREKKPIATHEPEPVVLSDPLPATVQQNPLQEPVQSEGLRKLRSLLLGMEKHTKWPTTTMIILTGISVATSGVQLFLSTSGEAGIFGMLNRFSGLFKGNISTVWSTCLPGLFEAIWRNCTPVADRMANLTVLASANISRVFAAIGEVLNP